MQAAIMLRDDARREKEDFEEWIKKADTEEGRGALKRLAQIREADYESGISSLERASRTSEKATAARSWLPQDIRDVEEGLTCQHHYTSLDPFPEECYRFSAALFAFPLHDEPSLHLRNAGTTSACSSVGSFRLVSVSVVRFAPAL